MAKPTVVVFTGNSNIGFSAIEYLVNNFADKVHIRAVFRSKGNAACLGELENQEVAQQIEVVTGDIKKKQILAPVFEGASVAFFATPTTQDRADLGKLFVDACFDHGVPNCVLMSVACADKKETVYQRQFAELEEYAMKRDGRSVTLKVADKGLLKFAPIIVRSVPFFQNFYGSLPGIKKGILYYPLEDGDLFHVDLNDVGKAVAHILVDPTKHRSQVYTITGESQDGTMIAGTISMKAGFQCEYKSVPDEIAVLAFNKLGLQEWIAEGNVETLKFFREGGGRGMSTGDFTAITGQTQYKFATFVKEYIRPMVA